MLDFKRYIFLSLIFSLFGIFFIPETVFAACKLDAALQLNKQSATVPIPYPEGENLTATAKVAQGSSCEGFRVEFRVCGTRLGIRECRTEYGAVILGNPAVQGGTANVSWTVKNLNNSNRYWVRGVVGTGVGSGTSEAISPGFAVVSGSTCSISSFNATTSGNKNYDFSVKSNSNCEDKIVAVDLWCTSDTGNTTYNCTDNEKLPAGQIKNSQFSGSWLGTPPTKIFFFKACIIGGGCIDSYISARPPGGTCGDGACNLGESTITCPQDCKTGTCNNNGICDAGEISATCKDCPVAPGATQSFPFSIKNPLRANNLIELIDVIATWLFNIAIPITVAMIVYAGIIFLISKGEPAKITQAKNILLYAVVGFAIILIGKGFITLIESILNLGATP